YWIFLGPDSLRGRKAVSKDLKEAVEDVLSDRNKVQGLARIHEAARSDNTFERTSAVGAIGFLGKRAVTLIPDLVDALHSSDPYVLREAAIASGKMGNDGAPLVPALQRLLQFEGPD